MNQQELELQWSKEGTNHYLFEKMNKSLADEVFDIVSAIESYVNKEHDYTYTTQKEPDVVKLRSDLREAHDAIREVDLESLVWRVMTFIVSMNKQRITHQAVVGMVVNAFECTTMFRKLKAAEIVLTFIEKNTSLVQIENDDDYTYWVGTKGMGSDSIKEVNQRKYVLPSIDKPLPVTNNYTIGYHTIIESVISGKGKAHGKPLNLHHINRKNYTPFKFEYRLPQLTDPVFNPKPKVKKDGSFEDEFDIQERKESFDRLHSELPERYALMFSLGNRFYIHHKYDNRGRTITKSNHFNYLGSKYIKAANQLANKELAEGEW